MARSEPNQRPIVVVTEGGSHIWAIVNAVADQLGPVSVILEASESKKQLLLARARRQGWTSAMGHDGADAPRQALLRRPRSRDATQLRQRRHFSFLNRTHHQLPFDSRVVRTAIFGGSFLADHSRRILIPKNTR
ncbi:hypothetical protein NKH98_06080 [Mesorhizobium sp. M0833]|uniref:hypothetical protein n=1 Tax=Mesorhizobium sp. M0833 TaxID=2957009 RepID=UPI00333CCD84